VKMDDSESEKKDDAVDGDDGDNNNQNLTSDSFKMYYALGTDTDIDKNSILETCKNAKDEVKEQINIPTEIDSRSSSRRNSGIIPPDVVTSAKKIRIVTEEPKRFVTNVSFDNRDDPVNHLDDARDYTSMQRQMDAYKNLEDLLDVPWEESDLAPPNKVDVVLRVGGEIGERYNNVFGREMRKKAIVQMKGDSEANYQCGPVCQNYCALM